MALAPPTADSLATAHPDFPLLLAALRHATGFSLLLVVCNSVGLRERVLDFLEKEIDRPLLRIDLRDVLRAPDRGEAIDDLVATATAQAPPEAVLSVTGLEAGLSSDEDERSRRFLQELNMRRGGLQRLQRPLLLWLPEYAMKQLARGAPDLHDWYSGAYSFIVREDHLLLQYHPLDWSQGAPFNLTVEEKHQHLETLRSLLHTAQEAGDMLRQTLILRDMSKLERSLLEWDAALEYGRAALDLFESLKDERGMAVMHGEIAGILSMLGEWEKALLHQKTALSLLESMGNLHGVALSKSNLAVLLANTGESDVALHILEHEVLPVLLRLGDKRNVAGVYSNVADVLLFADRVDEALQILLEHVIPVFEDIQDARSLAVAQGQVAYILYRLHRLDEAMVFLRERQRLIENLGDNDLLAATLWQQALIELQQGNTEAAALIIEIAYAMALEIGRLDAVAVIGKTRGRLLADAGKGDEAREVLLRSLEAFRTLGKTEQAAEVEREIFALNATQ